MGVIMPGNITHFGSPHCTFSLVLFLEAPFLPSGSSSTGPRGFLPTCTAFWQPALLFHNTTYNGIISQASCVYRNTYLHIDLLYIHTLVCYNNYTSCKSKALTSVSAPEAGGAPQTRPPAPRKHAPGAAPLSEQLRHTATDVAFPWCNSGFLLGLRRKVCCEVFRGEQSSRDLSNRLSLTIAQRRLVTCNGSTEAVASDSQLKPKVLPVEGRSLLPPKIHNLCNLKNTCDHESKWE